MVKFVYLSAIVGLANAAWTSCATDDDCTDLPKSVQEGHQCLYNNDEGKRVCTRVTKKLSWVHNNTRDLEDIPPEEINPSNLVNNITRSTGGNPNSYKAIELRNTYQWCAIPVHGIIYKEVDEIQQPIVDKCWHNASGNLEDNTKLKNTTVGIDGQICKLRCRDRRMDPYFAMKETKVDPRVFQTVCDCNSQKKGPGYCGWKTFGTKIKEFAGGNLMCRYTHFASKEFFDANYQSKHPNDETMLGNWAAGARKKRIVNFDLSNFNVEYKAVEKYTDDSGKKKARFVPITDMHWYYEPEELDHQGNPKLDTGLRMFPTDMVDSNDKKRNDNQHNKVEEKNYNVRAFVSCKSHTNGRYFASFEPNCRNKRHVLKKGTPGYCNWKTIDVHPNYAATHTEDDLGFDINSPKTGKPSKHGKASKEYGVKGKKAESVISAIMKANKYWRCPDFLDQKQK